MILDNKNILITILSLAYAHQTFAQQTLAVPTSNFPWKNSYPADGSKPDPKPEWLALVKDDPVLKVSPNILTAGTCVCVYIHYAMYTNFIYRWHYSKC